ncbi:hypothetical protein [uncultured Eubacterium sp.]|jgi:hypothetical protein|uniref:hypothetical protein n=1 Tax=uncultured Eubacterium sp. TaxID=165185 RepID=UPI002675DE46|nr:hypothetical protein [uncultured Eubacterium sp.]
MRLIDSDETIKQYTQIFVEKYGIECGEMFQGVLKQMPTAYDVDKVVEQLGKKQNNKGFGGTIQEIFYDSGLEDAVEIVKGGGLDG